MATKKKGRNKPHPRAQAISNTVRRAEGRKPARKPRKKK